MLLGVDETTVYNWERRRTTPARRFHLAVAAFLSYGPAGTRGAEGVKVCTFPLKRITR